MAEGAGHQRLATGQLPPAARRGDSDDGDLAVFGTNIGGGSDANVARWRKQFSTPDGQPVADDAFHREVLDVNGLKITFVDVTGQFTGMLMPGRQCPREERLSAARRDRRDPRGPWYFKPPARRPR